MILRCLVLALNVTILLLSDVLRWHMTSVGLVYGRFIEINNLITLTVGTSPFCVRIVIFHYMLLSYVLMRSALFWFITQDIPAIPH